MNTILHQPYYGLDEHGRTVSGIIERVARYGKGSVPTAYAVRPYQGEGNGCAIVKAIDIEAHIKGMELIASMETGKE